MVEVVAPMTMILYVKAQPLLDVFALERTWGAHSDSSEQEGYKTKVSFGRVLLLCIMHRLSEY